MFFLWLCSVSPGPPPLQAINMHGRLAGGSKAAVMKNKDLDEVLLKLFIEWNAYTSTHWIKILSGFAAQYTVQRSVCTVKVNIWYRKKFVSLHIQEGKKTMNIAPKHNCVCYCSLYVFSPMCHLYYICKSYLHCNFEVIVQNVIGLFCTKDHRKSKGKRLIIASSREHTHTQTHTQYTSSTFTFDSLILTVWSGGQLRESDRYRGATDRHCRQCVSQSTCLLR